VHATKEKALSQHYRMSKSGQYKNIELQKEEVEQVDEVSTPMLARYVKGAARDTAARGERDGKSALDKNLKRQRNIEKATEKIALRAMAKEEVDPPFIPDKKKSSANVTDKSGAHHTAMSRVRHLAKQALEKQKKIKNEEIEQVDELDKD